MPREVLDEAESAADAPNLVPEGAPRNILAGRIELLEKIGEGGMGAVYRGYHLKLGRAVAVKVLDETLQLRFDGRERFIREAQALALLEHRNIVRIHDCDQAPDGKLYLCMELLAGETLRALIRRGPPLDPLEVIEVGLQVCDALEAAHKQGILHRDLTPSNIIRLRDPARTIKVIDWGLCKYLDLYYVRTTQKYAAPPGSRLVTPFGCRFGNPEYMAPEMLRREDPGKPSFCTDVYALGVVLFEVLTGRHPFVPGDRSKPRPIRSILPGFEYHDLETALRAALRFDPDELVARAWLRPARTRSSPPPRVRPRVGPRGRRRPQVVPVRSRKSHFSSRRPPC
ncbi:MAG: serine/threonine protein kinase [Nannocystis sp.]|nr:serine/threonine-protein kinase [Nannocystis sp.]MBA3546611.1 serine/threonine protein kinase [Nannocystis sp.]